MRETSETGEGAQMSKKNTLAGGRRKEFPSQDPNAASIGPLVSEYAEWLNLTKCGLVVNTYHLRAFKATV